MQRNQSLLNKYFNVNSKFFFKNHMEKINWKQKFILLKNARALNWSIENIIFFVSISFQAVSSFVNAIGLEIMDSRHHVEDLLRQPRVLKHFAVQWHTAVHYVLYRKIKDWNPAKCWATKT